jgi:peptidoglycan/LPS O-acetylase OafA/YrhL
MTKENTLKLYGLDELRGLAAIMVLIYHLYQSFFRGIPNYNDEGIQTFPKTFLPIFNSLNELNAGVNLFFVLSGFLIHYLYSKKLFDSKQSLLFLKKRFLRIVPPYYFSILITVIGGLIIGYLTISVKDLASHLLFINNFSAETAFTIQAVYWSIAIEVQFYILYNLYKYLSDKLNYEHKLLWFFIIMFSISIIYKLLLLTTGQHYAALRWETLYNVLLRFPEWLIGAIFYQYGDRILQLKNKIILIILFLISNLVFNHYFIYHLFVSDILYALAFGLLIWVLIERRIQIYFFQFLGRISYSMYLNHFLIYSIWDVAIIKLLNLPRVASWERLLTMSTGLIVSIIGSYILYKLIEEPSLKIKSLLA